MRPIYPLAAGATLAACLAGWVALAWGQPNSVMLSSAPTPADPAPALPSAPTPAPNPPPAAPPVPPKSEYVPGPGPAPVAVPGFPAQIPPGLPSTAPAPPPTMTSPPPPPAPIPTTPTPPSVPMTPPPLPPDNKLVPQAAENTTGRQDAAVSVEWVGPPAAKIGVATEYVLVVRNTAAVALHNARATVVMPAGLRVTAAEPAAGTDGAWELGTLDAKQERVIKMRLVAEARGDPTPQAFVTFTGVASMRVKVREPKLVVKAAGPERVMAGESAAFTVTVSNPGDGTAEQVKVHATLSEGLEHARGPLVDFDIGSLGAGESRSVQIICQAKQGGAQTCKAVADADGVAAVTESAVLNVIAPRLEVQVSGPGLRYLERKALYTIKVTNTGDAAATNVTVGDVVPAGFLVQAASNGGRHDTNTRTVAWFLGEVAPGQSREVQLEVKAVIPGRHVHKATAVGARGLHADGECTTSVEGLSALGVELVDTEDPVEVNGETAYEVKISNTGSKTETDIKLVAEVPPQMQFKSATGPVRYAVDGNKIVFEPLDKLAPRVDALFRINVKAVEQGTVRFKIQVTSTNLVEPVIKMEATRIYADSPEPKP
jgi:uncharacterized repeat protein (TIGR01451 family)